MCISQSHIQFASNQLFEKCSLCTDMANQCQFSKLMVLLHSNRSGEPFTERICHFDKLISVFLGGSQNWNGMHVKHYICGSNVQIDAHSFNYSNSVGVNSKVLIPK